MIRLLVLFGCVMGCAFAFEPLTLILPEGEFWSGQPIPVSLELRGRGSFQGAVSFDLPEIPKTQWIRMGNPVLGSERDPEGEVFLQRHDFALVTQEDGALRIPPVTARFRVIPTGGQGQDIDESTEEASIPVKRPPGVADGQFVVTASSYDIRQTWSTQEERVDLGTIVSREVVQTVEGLSGMFLAPLPQSSPEGVRVYQPEQEVNDRENRGDLTGSRRDVLRYRMEWSGKVTLPAVVYRVWDPEKEVLQPHRIKGLTLRVKGAPVPLTGPGGWVRRVLTLVIAGGVLFLIWKKRELVLLLIPPKSGLPPLNPGRGEDS